MRVSPLDLSIYVDTKYFLKINKYNVDVFILFILFLLLMLHYKFCIFFLVKMKEQKSVYPLSWNNTSISSPQILEQNIENNGFEDTGPEITKLSDSWKIGNKQYEPYDCPACCLEEASSHDSERENPGRAQRTSLVEEMKLRGWGDPGKNKSIQTDTVIRNPCAGE